MASSMMQVCQLIAVMLAVCVITTSAQTCTSNGDCSNGQVCYKRSGCTTGACQCARNWNAVNGICTEASTLLSDGDTCLTTSTANVCDEYDLLTCASCPEAPTVFQCRSGAITLHISIIAVLSPIIAAFFM